MNTNISELIDLEKVSELLEGFNKSTGFVTAILDLEGNVLSKSGWRHICTDFHRVHPETSKRCTFSDTILAAKMSKGRGYHTYTCLNGLTDVAVPLIIKGKHLANLFSGQFFLEKPDLDFFKKQGKDFGFDEKTYIDALSHVPVVSVTKVKTVMDFLLKMTDIISELGVEKAEEKIIKQNLEYEALNEELRRTNEELNAAIQREEESIDRFNKAMEATSDGLFDRNLITNEIYYSPRWTSMLGYKEDELPNDFFTWEKLVAPEDLKHAWAALNEVIEGKKDKFDLVFRMKHKKGHWVNIHSRANLFRDKQGKAVRLVGTHTDITRKKRDQKIQKIIHNISNAVVTGADLGSFIKLVKNELDRIIDTTNFFIALYDEETERIFLPFHHNQKDSVRSLPVGKTFTNYVIKTGKPLLATKAVADQLIKAGEVELIGHPSETWLGIPLKNRNKVTGIFSVQSYDDPNAYDESDLKMLEIISHQISLSIERLKTEESTRNISRRLQISTESANIGIWELNLKNNVLTWDKQMFALYGMEPENFGGAYEIWRNCLHPGDVRRADAEIQDAIAGRKDFHTHFRVVRPDGQVRFFEAHALVTRDQDGNPDSMIGVNWDITDQKETEHELILAKERAEESDRLKSAFLANMSHEIRTPMNGILGFTQLLKEPHLSGAEKDEFIQIIEKSGNRMLNTINDIINISKIEAGQVEVVNSQVCVTDLLDEVHGFFLREAKSKGLNLILKNSLSQKEARIVSDRTKIESVLINLIKNAIKYTQKGEIEVGCTLKKNVDGKLMVFYVRDTGIGIPSEKIGQVFNRFEQIDIKEKMVVEGSGLGLAISKSYVEMLGGKIDVRSKEDSGSTFTFSIPCS